MIFAYLMTYAYDIWLSGVAYFISMRSVKNALPVTSELYA